MSRRPPENPNSTLSKLNQNEVVVLTEAAASTYLPNGSEVLCITNHGGRYLKDAQGNATNKPNQQDRLGLRLISAKDTNNNPISVLYLVVADGIAGNDSGAEAAQIIAEGLANAPHDRSMRSNAETVQTLLKADLGKDADNQPYPTLEAPGAVVAYARIVFPHTTRAPSKDAQKNEASPSTFQNAPSSTYQGVRAGDARIYFFRKGKPPSENQITITQDDATKRPKNGRIASRPDSALAANDESLDWANEPEPSELQKGDILLLSSDGAHVCFEDEAAFKEFIQVIENIYKNPKVTNKPEAVKNALANLKGAKRDDDNASLLLYCHGMSLQERFAPQEALAETLKAAAQNAWKKVWGTLQPAAQATIPVLQKGYQSAQENVPIATGWLKTKITENPKAAWSLAGSTSLVGLLAIIHHCSNENPPIPQEVYAGVCEKSVPGLWTIAGKSGTNYTFPQKSLVNLTVFKGGKTPQSSLKHYPSDYLKGQAPRAIAAWFPNQKDVVKAELNGKTLTLHFTPSQNTPQIQDVYTDDLKLLPSSTAWITCGSTPKNGCVEDAKEVKKATE